MYFPSAFRREASMMKKGNLVGTDQHGNKYYENLQYQAGA